MSRELKGLNEIASEFDAVIVDQYGVLHDGQTAFSGALEALTELNSRNIPVVALTNSGKRAQTNARRLARLGFPNDLFHAVVSSGEIARDRIAHLHAGSTVLLVARQGERDVIDGLNVKSADIGDPADLIVIAAVEPSLKSRSDYANALSPYADRRVPALLVNPDDLAIENGNVVFGPGAVAKDYARSGGPVEVLGKPARQMFDTALQALGNPPADRVLMIGDSPHHDIQGASDLGLKTLLVLDGVQSGLEGIDPTFTMKCLAWV